MSGEQIAWIDHLKLEDGTLFREAEQVFRLAEDGALQQVRTGMIDSVDLMDATED